MRRFSFVESIVAEIQSIAKCFIITLSLSFYLEYRIYSKTVADILDLSIQIPSIFIIRFRGKKSVNVLQEFYVHWSELELVG
jgi:hypothetical protein